MLKGEKQPKSDVTQGWAGVDWGVLEWKCSLGADMMMIGGRVERLCGGDSRSRSQVVDDSNEDGDAAMGRARAFIRRPRTGGGRAPFSFLPRLCRPEGRLAGRDGPVQRERLDVEMKSQGLEIPQSPVFASRFSAPCHSSPVYGAVRAEAVPHAGMCPPCLPVLQPCQP